MSFTSTKYTTKKSHQQFDHWADGENLFNNNNNNNKKIMQTNGNIYIDQFHWFPCERASLSLKDFNGNHRN